MEFARSAQDEDVPRVQLSVRGKPLTKTIGAESCDLLNYVCFVFCLSNVTASSVPRGG